MTAKDVEVLDPPEPSGDRCLTCNVPIQYGGRGRRPKYCDEHRVVSGKTSGGLAKPKVAAQKASGLITKLLIVVTVLLAEAKISKGGFSDPTGTLAEELALKDDEAEAMAQPLARWASKSSVGSKVLGPVVENEDLLDAGIALWDYSRRVNRILKAQKQFIRSVSNESHQPSEKTSGASFFPVESPVWATI